MDAKRAEVEAVKLALGNIKARETNSKKILEQSICTLVDLYEAQSEDVLLEKALVHMTAYLELGFPYVDMQKTFDVILQKYHLNMDQIVDKSYYVIKKRPLRKCHVKAILGRWNPKLHSHKIDDAVNDIIRRITHKEKGTYLYHTGKIVAETEGQVVWEKTFYLYVTENDSLVYDVNRNQYYTFSK